MRDVVAGGREDAQDPVHCQLFEPRRRREARRFSYQSSRAHEFPRTLAYLHPGEALLGEIATASLEAVISCRARKKVDLDVARRLSRVIDHDCVDVVYCTNLYAMLYGVMARARSKRRPRLIMAFHTTLLGNWRNRLQMAFYWPLFRQCDHLIYVCGNQGRHWRRLGLRAREDGFIYNGVDTDHYSLAEVKDEAARIRKMLGFASDELVVGICAGLRPEKAHGDLWPLSRGCVRRAWLRAAL
ncbi:MAG: glycosyltransferase [Ahniella sp.]|nr:glycosyltransferase [Ahniella sp.]